MPSQLGNLPRRYLDANTIGSKTALRAEEALPLQIGPPFGGYTPDLAPAVAGLSDAKMVTGLIQKGGILLQDDGFSKVDSARLPLGATALPSATAKPVVGLFQSYDVGSAPGPVRLAMTSQDGTISHIYELVASTGQWTNRTEENAGRKITQTTTSADLWDYAFFPPALVAGGLKGTAILTNNKDQIIRYPSATTATTYDYFDTANIYRAKSVEVSEDRVLALNVDVPTDGRIYNRLIYTNKGSAASFNLAGTGAGRIDFVDVKGQGLKVMNLGQLVALYFESAVVVLQRTGTAVDPFRRLYTSNDRGLLSTQSVVQLGSGVHFGIFTDGWFFFDDQARWEEVGLKTVGQGSFHKWHKTFYELLDWENRARVAAVYDPVNRFVRIAFPTKGNSDPNMVWNYDLLTDTVWPDENYGTLAPNIWGSWFDIAQTGTTIDNLDTIAGSIDTLPGTFDDYSSTRGRYRILHGTTLGQVFKHDPFLATRDGQLSTYNYTSHRVQVGGSHLQKTGKRLIVGYNRIASPSGDTPSPILAQITADSGQVASRSIPQTKGSVGDVQTDWVSGQVSGTHLGWGISGTAPVNITSADILVTVLGRSIANA